MRFNQRQYDLFISHAHADREFVENLYAWLTNQAGFKVFYDPSHATPGSGISSMLQEEIENCRGLILVISEASVDSEWVRDEYNIAKDESNEQPDFRILPVRLDRAPGKKLIKGVSWLDVPESRFSPETASGILRGLYHRKNLPDPSNSRDIFVSASWQTDNKSALAVSRYLLAQGFRLIGDAKDQDKYDIERIKRIMRTCGAFVAIVPFRDQQDASATERPYKYFLQETDAAESLDLPIVVVADPRIKRIDGDDSHWLRLPTDQAELSQVVTRSLDLLWDDWESPALGNHVFLALSQEAEQSPRTSALRQVIESVTGMHTILGSKLQGQEQAGEIQRYVTTAALVVADITDDNVNVCVEVGMAKAAERPYELISEGEPRSGPFMIRGPNIAFYDNPLGQLGALHKVVRNHRRRILNVEL
jgi:hypothetical protein